VSFPHGIFGETLARHFAAIGASLRVADEPWLGAPRIDVRTEGRQEYFDLAFTGSGEPADACVVDTAAADRHLLLLVRHGGEKSKFLCGHDERHWFIAAVPETARGVTGVEAAKAALQPPVVALAAERLRRKRRFDRRTPAYLRQGEWFFVPEPDLRVDERFVLCNEPLARPGGTPHVLRDAHRRGGHVVYVHRPTGRMIGEAEHARLSGSKRRNSGWQRMIRDPELFARGSVRHPDHATVLLRGWHRVLMNTEGGARANVHVAFLD
jgi:hypothetical protein